MTKGKKVYTAQHTIILQCVEVDITEGKKLAVIQGLPKHWLHMVYHPDLVYFG